MRDLFVTIALLVITPAALFQPWLGILGWNWIGLMNPHRLTWSFASSLPVANMVGVATLIGLLFARSRKGVPWTREMVLLALFCAHMTFTTANALVPDYAQLAWQQSMKIQLMTFVTTMLIFGEQRIRALLYVIAGSIGFYGVKGGIFSLSTGGVHHVRGPAGSFVESNNDIGLALLMVVPVMIALSRDTERAWLRRVLQIAAGLSIVAAVFTYSRGALVGLAVVVFLLLLASRRKLAAFVVLVPFALLVANFAPEKLYKRAESIESFDRDMSSMQRIQAWYVAVNLALSRPLTGGGFKIQYLPDEEWVSHAPRDFDKWGQQARAAHSIYFQVLGEHGFLGLGLFLAILASCIRTLGRIRKEALARSDLRGIARFAEGLRIGILGYASCGAFLSQAYFDLFWTFVALTAILAREVAERAAKQPALEPNGTPPQPSAA